MTRTASPARRVHGWWSRTSLLLVALLSVWIMVPAAAPSSQSTPVAKAPPAATVQTDPADPIFDGTVLHDIRLTMKPEDWATLKARVLWNDYYPADFTWRDTTVATSAIRSRGSGSRNSRKPGIRIDFNRYVDQKFLGLGSLILANAVQDPGMLNRRLAMAVYARMGVPASRVVHTRLFVNGEYIGLYELMEEPAKPMLLRLFGVDANGKKRNGGYLFEYKWEDGFAWTYPGTDLTRYAALFQPETREDDPPADLYGPIADLFRTINEASDAEFESRACKFLDLPQLVKFLAVERFMADIDGFLGQWGPNNFYLYRFEVECTSLLIPWDKDLAFYELYDDIYQGIDGTVLGRRLMAVPALRRLYLRTLLDTAASVSAPDAPGSPTSWFEAEMLRERAQILDAGRADPNKPYPSERIEEAHAELLDFIRKRAGYVTGQAQRELARLARDDR